MAIYRYSDQSRIDEVHIQKDKAGREVRAYLHARAGVEPEALIAIAKRLGEAGFIAVPGALHGVPMLEVRGFRKGDNLTDILHSAGAIGAHTAREAQQGDKASPKDKVKKATLRAAGGAYYVGDIAFFTYGVGDRNLVTIAGALGYFAGTNVLAWFGGTDHSPYQVQDAARKMKRFLTSEGVTPQDSGALHEVTRERKRNPWQKFIDTCRKYPSEVFSFIYIFTGLLIAFSTRKDFGALAKEKELFGGWLKDGTIEGRALNQDELSFLREYVEHTIPHNITAKYMDVGLGSITTAASLFPLLVREKARDPAEPKRKGLAGAWDWMRERPLKVQGIGYLMSTLCHVGSTFTEMRAATNTITNYQYIENHIVGHTPGTKIKFTPNPAKPAESLPLPMAPSSPIKSQKLFDKMAEVVQGARAKKSSLVGRVVFVLANLGAEVMIYCSSKGHGDGVKADDSIEKSVAALAAGEVARQPKEKQDALIERLAGYLATPEVMGGKSDSIAGSIRLQLAALETNPWAKAFTAPAASEFRPVPQEKETLAPVVPIASSKKWKERMKPNLKTPIAAQMGA